MLSANNKNNYFIETLRIDNKCVSFVKCEGNNINFNDMKKLILAACALLVVFASAITVCKVDY